jgi:hypothetical protein
VRGHQDRARHEETASRTWARPPHCLPRKNPSIRSPRPLLHRVELWQNETFCFSGIDRSIANLPAGSAWVSQLCGRLDTSAAELSPKTETARTIAACAIGMPFRTFWWPWMHSGQRSLRPYVGLIGASGGAASLRRLERRRVSIDARRGGIERGSPYSSKTNPVWHAIKTPQPASLLREPIQRLRRSGAAIHRRARLPPRARRVPGRASRLPLYGPKSRKPSMPTLKALWAHRAHTSPRSSWPLRRIGRIRRTLHPGQVGH